MSFTRRGFIQSSAAMAAMGCAGPASAATLPVPFRFAYSAISWDQNIEEAIKVGQRLKMPGIEPFRTNVENYLERPLVLKKLLDDAGIAMASCSNGGAPGDGKVRQFSSNFYDASKVSQTVEDHVRFVRDFIKPFGTVNHFKMNPGPRPAGYDVSDAQIRICADAMNAIGRETIRLGVKLAPHPHVGALIQNEHEVRTFMAQTDPRYVWLTTDTSHLTLGGMDPLQIMKDYWPRVVEVHYKDAPRRLRGNKVVAVPRSGPESGGHGWFRNLNDADGGGVDFPAIHQFLIDRKFTGWVTLDLDASMIPKGGTMEETIKGNLGYLINTLHVDPNTV